MTQKRNRRVRRIRHICAIIKNAVLKATCCIAIFCFLAAVGGADSPGPKWPLIVTMVVSAGYLALFFYVNYGIDWKEVEEQNTEKRRQRYRRKKAKLAAKRAAA